MAVSSHPVRWTTVPEEGITIFWEPYILSYSHFIEKCETNHYELNNPQQQYQAAELGYTGNMLRANGDYPSLDSLVLGYLK